MKKLLLTSTGFLNPKIGEEFLSLLDKKPVDARVLFIPTAAVSESQMKYVRADEGRIIQVGVPKENIVWLDIDNVPAVGDLSRFDVIYVCGGNTFFLMQKLKETGLDKKIIELVNQGKVYVGASAGSVIAGSDISIAGPFDENDVGLKDMAGLGLTDKVIYPHYKDEEKNIFEEFKSKLLHTIVPITDSQALEEIGGSSVVVE